MVELRLHFHDTELGLQQRIRFSFNPPAASMPIVYCPWNVLELKMFDSKHQFGSTSDKELSKATVATKVLLTLEPHFLSCNNRCHYAHLPMRTKAYVVLRRRCCRRRRRSIT